MKRNNKINRSPGPWRVERAMSGELEPFDTDGRHLLSSKGERPLSLTTRLHNAALIQSAPDLLHYLKEAYDSLNYLEPETFDDETHQESWRNQIQSIEEVIYNAEHPIED